jgi:hypothetical protein
MEVIDPNVVQTVHVEDGFHPTRDRLFFLNIYEQMSVNIYG